MSSSIQYQVEVRGGVILSLFLIIGEYSVFTIKYDIIYRFFTDVFYQGEISFYF